MSVRFQVLAAASMKVTVLWNALRSLVESDWRIRGAYSILQGDESGSKHLWNVG
jgi:hypothetical protein